MATSTEVRADFEKSVETTTNAPQPIEVVLYEHSSLIYWWPVWVLGYVLAILTYANGNQIQLGESTVWIHPSKNLGVIFTVVFFLVIVLTNFTVRGVASVAVVATILALTFAFAYMNWWDDVFRAVDMLAIYMNLGFFIFFSTAILLVWLCGFFIVDRLESWAFRPGQLEHRKFGGGSQLYDTGGMTVHKLRDDMFRHWILGLGTGDVHVGAPGKNGEMLVMYNVVRVNSKLPLIEKLVAMKPDQYEGRPITVGAPV